MAKIINAIFISRIAVWIFKYVVNQSTQMQMFEGVLIMIEAHFRTILYQIAYWPKKIMFTCIAITYYVWYDTIRLDFGIHRDFFHFIVDPNWKHRMEIAFPY